ncbi:hypothetical protein [Bosea sp. Leaf344]|uniref:hypothetical protein n=1 Tax=Bosea sp. Leaf344 TaxID=1736346 RepID=UPI000AEC08FB|nr:hypothetical protein [Bosea sp. Leaf344]
MADTPKLPAPRRKSQALHTVQFRSKWIEGAASGHGIYILPIVTLIVALIVVSVPVIIWRW